MVRPLEDGFQFSVHGTKTEPKNPEDVVAGNKRNFQLNYAGAMERMRSLEKGIDRSSIQRKLCRDMQITTSSQIVGARGV